MCTFGPAYVGVYAQIHEYAHVPMYPRAHTCKGVHMYVCVPMYMGCSE